MVEQSMQEMSEADNGPSDFNAGDGRMLTALTWVSRGHAKAVLDLANPEEDERSIREHSRMQKKLAK